ncbi:hypothetical protein DESUT3_14180 [Desulfuromonas versatilis]|uniref:Rhodanese domain-containing protein n=1 Tax=Desulfuromonas versatilis TaxID=2802975 RepID=A0ABM8HQD8_9BACT|nr:rhodanese-like domain-containing protein [Desulfuromonas versatilis]BCR04349.1 hypothetical protein DESUT3_14180 [Desulfuromonas versatilis]
MKILTWLAIFATFTLWIGGCAPAAGPAPGHAEHDHDHLVSASEQTPTITIDQVRQRLERGEEIIFIDTRNPDAWGSADNMIPGAIRIGSNEQLLALVRELPRDSFIVPYCT